MNVESLRSNQDANDNSAEIRVTKVGLGLSTMFAFSWIPYATVALIGAFGNRRVSIEFQHFISMLQVQCRRTL